MLNLAQRELLDIARLRNAIGKRFVLVRTGFEEASGVSEIVKAGGAIAGVPVEHIAVIDELDDDLMDELFSP